MKVKQKRRWLLPILLAGAAALLLILYLTVLLPILSQDDNTIPEVSVGEGEGAHYNKGTLYPAISRNKMVSITVHNEKGTYRFARVPKEGKEVAVTDAFEIFKEKNGEYIRCETVYDQERFSELVVATGTFYYLRNLTTEPELLGKALDLADYGLSEADDPAWFEIETFKDGKVRVYVGDAAVTDNGYYVYVEGRKTPEGNPVVYVSNSNLVGETALANLPSFVDPTLTSPITQYEYYYSKEFTLWRPAPLGYRATAEDTVSYRYYMVTDGVSSELMEGSSDLRDVREEIRDAFLGVKVGDGGAVFHTTYPEETPEGMDDAEYDAVRGKTVYYHIEEITEIKQLYIALDFLNPSERSKFSTGVAYAITAPADKTAFLPSSNSYMGILETIGNLVGVETVEVGVDADVIEKYGLMTYKIYYRMPISLSYKENSDDIVVKEYLDIYLYISEKQEDGSYYVASIFPGTDIVARVEGETLAFLERADIWWLDDTMYSVNVTNATELSFDFRYHDAEAAYRFMLSHTLSDSGRYSLSGVKEIASGKTLDVEHFKNLYMHLVTIYYSGGYEGDGALPKEEVLAGQEVLTMRVTIRDEGTYVYRFLPYSERHVLVSVAKEGETEGAFFYVLASEVEKIYRDIGLLLDGVCPDPEKQY